MSQLHLQMCSRLSLHGGNVSNNQFQVGGRMVKTQTDGIVEPCSMSAACMSLLARQT